VIDEGRLRAERRGRVLAGMAEDGMDALLLGTGANIRYATGARPLWLAGARPFAPLAVVLGHGETHLVVSSDDGVPPEVALADLLPTTWSPATLMARLAAVEGLASARRIGVDGLTPMFEQLLTSTFPDAALIDATPLLWRARATKTEDELALMRQATAICEEALQAVVDGLAEGVAEHDLQARFLERMAMLGTTIPAFDPMFRRAGELVTLDAGVLVDGYEGGLGRTWPAARAEAREALDALLERCRPGVSIAGLAAAVPDSVVPVAYGIGLGVEPLATEVGSTLCLQVLAGGVLLRETAVLQADGPELLTRFGAR
jgi:Xaa-Pro aminopeptidase